MKTSHANNVNIPKLPRIRRLSGFTLVEVVLSIGLITLLFLANLSALYTSRIQQAKDREMGIVTDFMIHYCEMVRGMEFEQIKRKAPLDHLYDGRQGSPKIIIPNQSTWFSIENDDYYTFHPDLAWLEGRNLELRVNLYIDTLAGEEHTKTLKLEVRWNAPLNVGGVLEERMDVVRFKDV